MTADEMTSSKQDLTPAVEELAALAADSKGESIAVAIQTVVDSLPMADWNLRQADRIPFARQVQVTKDNKTDLCAGKDISATGIGFFHVKPVYGAVIVGVTTPSGDFFRFLGEVVRTRQVGRLFEIGVKLVDRII